MVNGKNYKFSYFLFYKNNKVIILLLYGFMGSSNDFIEIIFELFKKFCCLIVDLLGYGKIRVFDSEKYYNMYNIVIVLIGLLDNLNIEKCYLFGYLMGGRLVLYLGINFLIWFEKIILELVFLGLKSKVE